jgi:hypothetical protein
VILPLCLWANAYPFVAGLPARSWAYAAYRRGLRLRLAVFHFILWFGAKATCLLLTRPGMLGQLTSFRAKDWAVGSLAGM